MIVQKFQSSQAYPCHTTAGDVASNEFCTDDNMTIKHEKHEENDFTVDAKETDTAASQEGLMFLDELKLYTNAYMFLDELKLHTHTCIYI